MLRSRLSQWRRHSNDFNWLSPESHRSTPKSRTTSFRSNERTINTAKKDLKKTNVKEDVKIEIKTDIEPLAALEIETKTLTFTDPEKSGDSECVALIEKERIVRVLYFDDLPAWMRIDPFIKRGYRQPSNSFKACFLSLFYPHNELVSTWSHLLPGLFFLGLLILGDYPLLHNISNVSRADNLAVQVYVCGTILCLFLSAFFHAVNAHSLNVARRSLKLDYLGIVLTISTTCMSATYFGLYGQPRLQAVYIAITLLCAGGVFWAVLGRKADGPRASKYRAAVFTALAVSGIIPIAQVALMEGSPGLARFPLGNIAITCSSYAIGTSFYVARLPEKRWPGTFDIWGSSHQIFHIAVAFGQIVHLLGLRDKLLAHYSNIEL